MTVPGAPTALALACLLLSTAAVVSATSALLDDQGRPTYKLDDLKSLDAASANGTLSPGYILKQGVELRSVDGKMALSVKPEGNLILQHSTEGYEVWVSHTDIFTPAASALVIQEDCNLVLFGGDGGAARKVWASGTGGEGTPPCALTVSGTGGGSLAVVDADNVMLFMRPLSPPGYSVAMLEAGQYLMQDVKLFSEDLSVYLTVEEDGNMCLYNLALVVKFNWQAPDSVIWCTNSWDTKQPGPYQLVMQMDCNLVLFGKNGQTPADKVWASGTETPHRRGEGTPPCTALVSSANGGEVMVKDSSGAVLFASVPFPHPDMPDIMSYSTKT